MVLLAPLLASGALAAGPARAQTGATLELSTVWGPVVISDANGDGDDDTTDYDTFVQNFEVTGAGIEPTHAAQLLCSYLERPTEAEFLDWPAEPGDAVCHLVIDAIVGDSSDVARLAARAEVDLAAFSCVRTSLVLTVFDATGGFEHLLRDRVVLHWTWDVGSRPPACDRLADGEQVRPSHLQPPTEFELRLPEPL